MKLPALLVSDLHLTDKVVDEYRWDLFPQLRRILKEEGIRTFACLGDTTDSKDYHSSTLVNRLVREVDSLRSLVEDVCILMGNHDYLKDGQPYLDFLNCLPGVRYITKPYEEAENDGPLCLWLPHTRKPASDWEAMRDVSWYSFLFMHQTVSGSRASNGQEMPGDGSDQAFLHWEGSLPVLWSGDIHVPQTLKTSSGAKVNYVGSPYHVHFGDSFEPRGALLIRKNGTTLDIPLNFPRRFTAKVSSIKELQALKVNPGDQVKVRLALSQAEAHEWPRLRLQAADWAKRKELVLHDVELQVEKSRRRLSAQVKATATPQQAVEAYVTAEDLGVDAFEAGLGILES